MKKERAGEHWGAFAFFFSFHISLLSACDLEQSGLADEDSRAEPLRTAQGLETDAGGAQPPRASGEKGVCSEDMHHAAIHNSENWM